MKYLLITFFLICFVPISGYTFTIHVPGDQPTIQAGIRAAVDGDTVLVADGTYSGDGNRDINFWGKAIIVMSESGPDSTILDCEYLEDHRGFYFHDGEDFRSRVTGFTIKNGNTNNGGGIYCEASSPTITNCIITGNEVYSKGGGICCELGSSPTITNCTINGNIAWAGGGIYCAWDSSPTITNCIISENWTDDFGQGGGIHCYESSPTITNCIITGNTAYSYGGGIYCNKSFPNITNCTITWNTAEIACGIFCYESSPIVTNCILWNYWEEIYSYSGDPVVTYSDVRMGWEGEGNIDEDPRFAEYPIHGFEYLLRSSSPCIDVGAPSIEDGLSDWHPRWPEWYPNGSRSDMGAYGGPCNIEWLR